MACPGAQSCHLSHSQVHSRSSSAYLQNSLLVPELSAIAAGSSCELFPVAVPTRLSGVSIAFFNGGVQGSEEDSY